MALGALIGAYRDGGGGGDLHATLPLAGRTLLEYQARLADAAGAHPVVVLVERMPPSLLAAVDRLAADGIDVQLARGVAEAAGFFDGSDKVLVLADGLFADALSVERIAAAAAPAVLTVPDNIGLDAFERIDGANRWAGLAVASGADLGATAAMLGDWDLQSTLLRRLVQGGARQIAAGGGTDAAAPLLVMASHPQDLDDAERRILAGARGTRTDWVERGITPMLEEWSAERLMHTRTQPRWLDTAALALMLAAAVMFALDARPFALGALLLSVPFDGIADRLGALRMQPRSCSGSRRWLPLGAAAALAGLSLGLVTGEGGWGAAVTGVAALGFFHSLGVEKRRRSSPPRPWLATRKGAILLGAPFALVGWWTAGLVAVAAYAAWSFLWLQRRAIPERLAPA